MTPDLAARRIVIASFLYYRCSESVMGDHEFDALCLYAADHWDELEPIRRWQLGSADAIRASGSHCRVTTYAAYSALQWLKDTGRTPTPEEIGYVTWTFNKEHRVYWTSADR